MIANSETSAKWLEATKQALEDFGYETRPSPGAFPLVATDQKKIVLVYIEGSNPGRSIETIDRTLGPFYHDKRFGALSRDIHALILCPDVPEVDRISAENDARICVKIVVPIGTDIAQDVRRGLMVLKPFDVRSEVRDFRREETQAYLEALREKLKCLESHAATKIERAFEEKWSASRIVGELIGEPK